MGGNPGPTSLALSSDSKSGVVVCSGLDRIATFSLETLEVTGSTEAGPTADGMGVG